MTRSTRHTPAPRPDPLKEKHHDTRTPRRARQRDPRHPPRRPHPRPATPHRRHRRARSSRATASRAPAPPRRPASCPSSRAPRRCASAPPIARPGKIVCIGLNYRDHAEETGAAVPAEPVVFMKDPSTVVGPFDDVLIPRALGEDRLGGRARRRDRQRRPATSTRPTTAARPRRRLRALARRVGARVPARARRPVGQGQELRDLQPARPRPRARGRGRRPAGPRPAAVGQRRAAPERHDRRA